MIALAALVVLALMLARVGYWLTKGRTTFQETAASLGLVPFEYGGATVFPLPGDPPRPAGTLSISMANPAEPFLRYIGPQGPVTRTVGDQASGALLIGPEIPTTTIGPELYAIGQRGYGFSSMRPSSLYQNFVDVGYPVRLPGEVVTMRWQMPLRPSDPAGFTFETTSGIYHIVKKKLQLPIPTVSDGYWAFIDPSGNRTLAMVGSQQSVISGSLSRHCTFVRSDLAEGELVLLMVVLLGNFWTLVFPNYPN